MNRIFGKKLGMTSLFDDKGQKVSVTVLQVFSSKVLQIKTPALDGYSALVMGFEDAKEKHVSKPQLGLFKKVNTAALRHIREAEATDYSKYQVGQALGVEVFEGAVVVDIVGISKGKGFQGCIRKHHFQRGRETHGNKSHRAPGSIGNHTDPAKVWKGKKMSGQMGNQQATVKHLKVFKVIADKNLLLVKGSVPGHNNRIVDIVKVK